MILIFTFSILAIFAVFAVFLNLYIVPNNNIKSFNTSFSSYEYLLVISSCHILYKKLNLFLQLRYYKVKYKFLKYANYFIIKLDILSILSSKILLLFQISKIPSFIY